MKWFLLGFITAVIIDKLWWKYKGKELYDAKLI